MEGSPTATRRRPWSSCATPRFPACGRAKDVAPRIRTESAVGRMARAGDTGAVVSLPAGGNVASGLHGAGVARGRDGARENHSSHLRLLVAASFGEGCARAGGDAGVAQ